MRRRWLLFLILTIVGFWFAGARSAEAAACQSAATGNWSAAGTWTNCGGTTPQAGDSVEIVSNHTVTANTTLPAIGDLTITSGTLALGTYSLSAGAVTLVSGTISSSSGILTGTSYDLQSGTVSAIIAGVGVAVNKTTSGTVTLSGANTFTGGLVILNGQVNGQTSANAFGAGTITLGNSAGGSDNATLLGNASVTFANPIVLASNTTGTLTVGLSSTFSPVFSGGVTGNNNLTLNNTNNTSRILTFSTGSINNVGTITHIGSTSGTVTISAVIGTNVTGVIQNSATSALTLSGDNTFTSGLTILQGTVSGATSANAFGAGTITLGNSAGGSDNATLLGNASVTFANPIVLASNTTGTLTVGLSRNSSPIFSGGVTGNNNLTLNNTSSSGSRIITFSTESINNVGTVTNSSTTIGPITISSVIGTNVTGVIQNSTTSALTLSGNNTFTSGLTIKAGTVIGATSNNAFGGSGTGAITLGDSSGSNNATLQSNISSGSFANPITVAAGSSGVLKIYSQYYTTFSGAITLNNNLTLSENGNTLTFTGGFTGTGNLTLSGGIAITTNPVNMVGTITNSSTISSLTTISAVIGTNVTGVVQDSSAVTMTLSGNNTFTSGLTILKGQVNGSSNTNALGGSGTGVVTLGNSAGGSDAAALGISGGIDVTFPNPIVLASNTTGTLTIKTTHTYYTGGFSGGITGTNNLTLVNVNTSGRNLTFSGGSIDNVGTITNASTGSNSPISISAVIGTNVTGLVQNSATSAMTLSGNNSTVGGVTITAGTLALSGTTNLNVSGNWSNSGTFTPNSGTVTFTSGTHILTDATTFYNLALAANSTTTFPISATQTLTNGLTCTGSAGNLITINSSSLGTQATLSMGAGKTANCDYLSLTDSAATGGATWNAGDHSLIYSNVTGWTGGITIPGVPTDLTPTAGVGEVDLSWTAPASNGGSAITDYVVEYKLTSEGSWSTFADGISDLTTTTVTGLTNGLSYDFRVSAVNIIGQGDPSDTATLLLPTVPDAPTIGTATRGNTEATITFTPPADDGGSAITGYTVTSNPGGLTATGPASPLTVTGLTNGTSYTFTVVATNAIGDSDSSAASNAVTPATIPNVPSDLAGDSLDQAVDLSWTAPSNGGDPIIDYWIEYKLTSGSEWGTFADGISPTASAQVTSLVNGSSYDFRVSAVNGVGTSTASSVETVTPMTVPDAPVNLAATVDDSSMKLAWTAPASNGGSAITDYVVEYKLTSGGVWSTFADGVSTVASTTVTGLGNDNSYDFRVSAKNLAGTGEASATVTATPGAPAQVLVQSFGDLTVPSISTAVRITNEGSTAYEYQYEWCVTDSDINLCGGGDDIFNSSAAKLIEAGTDWDTILSSTVTTPGTYWFHLAVEFGSDSSRASQSFVAEAEPVTPPTTPGRGSTSGGGGGAMAAPTSCVGADFNHDKKVNGVDFSILLAFWKTPAPFKNPCVDVNGDKQVNSADFSILLYQWGKSPTALKK